MKPDPAHIGNTSPPIKLIFVLVFFKGLEFGMWVLFYATYTETIGLMSDFYLADLPAVGPLVGAIDEEISAAHLLCMALAFFSVGRIASREADRMPPWTTSTLSLRASC